MSRAPEGNTLYNQEGDPQIIVRNNVIASSSE